MKLRLSTVGCNTDSFPPILVTDTGVQVMATTDSVKAAILECRHYLIGLTTIQDKLSQLDSTIESNIQSPDATAGSSSVATDTASSETKSTPQSSK